MFGLFKNNKDAALESAIEVGGSETETTTEPSLALTEPSEKRIPKGWIVFEAGQDPLHLLWYVVLSNFDDLYVNKVPRPRSFVEEECDSFDEALGKCIDRFNEVV